MKHEVLMAFQDKESGVYHMPNSFFVSNDEQRLKQLSELHVIKLNADFTFTKTQGAVKDDVSDLRTLAKQLKIKGYTKMSDAELEKAIAEHGGDENDDTAKSEELAED